MPGLVLLEGWPFVTKGRFRLVAVGQRPVVEHARDVIIVEIPARTDHFALHRVIVIPLDFAEVWRCPRSEKRFLVDLCLGESQFKVEVPATRCPKTLVGRIAAGGRTGVVCLSHRSGPPS